MDCRFTMRNLDYFLDYGLDYNYMDGNDDSFLDVEGDYEEGIDDVDLCTVYLNEIGRYSLLTLEEEIKYGNDLKLKDEIFIVTDKKINDVVYSVIDLERVFVSIDDIGTFKCVFDLISYYCFNSYRVEAIENRILSYYFSLYAKLVAEKGIPNNSILQQYFSDYDGYHVFDNFDVSKKIGSEELINQVNMYVKYLRAKEIMINHNLKLVVPIAKKYTMYMDFMDLINRGNIGLMKAVDKFDVKRGNRFSTYASWEIRKEIMEEISDNNSCIRIPINRKNQILSFWKRVLALNNKYGEKLTTFEIAQEFNMSIEEIKKFVIDGKKTTSLSVIMDSVEGLTLMDLVAISGFDVERRVLIDDLKENLDTILSDLDDRDRQVIKSRYCFDGAKYKKLRELASEYGVSVQMIHKSEIRGLRKMKKKAVKLKLDDYLYE